MSSSNIQRLRVDNSASHISDHEEGLRSRLSSNSGLPFANNAPSNSAASNQVSGKKRCQMRLQMILDHWLWTIWMTLVIAFALFGDDLKMLTTGKSADTTFEALALVTIVFFALELIFSSVSQEGYFLSFFFWLDLISTISIFADISWIWNSVVGSGTQGNQAAKTSQLARASRASRAGTKASRILRSIRVIRLLRLVKLNKLAQELRALGKKTDFTLYRGKVIYRGTDVPVSSYTPDVRQDLKDGDDAESVDSFSFTEQEPKSSMLENRLVSEGPSALLAHMNNIKTPIHSKNSEEAEEVRSSSPDPVDNKAKVPEESKVGKRLSDLTTKRVVILVLGMMFGLPLFTLSLYYEENNSFTFGLEMIGKFRDTQPEFDLCWTRYISEHKDIDTPLIYVNVDNSRKWEHGASVDDLRDVEQYVIDLTVNDGSLTSVFDYRKRNQVQAGLNIARTVFVCLVLAVSSMLFSKGANDLVLGPIENMIKRVKKISVNPLEAAQDEEREAVERERLMMENPKLIPKQSKKGGPMETEVLEQTIIKIGALLALGFGEAGTEVIATNMKKGGGEVDPMIPGKKTHCIFGFCDIRNFTDATEVLQEGVMVFVNEIAEIVHSIVYLHSGSANKNIGDAFLLVWKFPNSIKWGESHKPNSFVRQLSDMSLISFLKIIAEINKNPKILKYRKNEELRRRMPNYCVRMGFGLHVGWAIEGAIGSEFKVDASYLSPHVNTASRLEAATKVYGVPLLLSGKLAELFSKETKAKLRQIDRVTIKGSKDPLSLYTCDVDPTVLPPGIINESDADQDMKVRKVKMRLERDRLKKDVMKNAIEMWRKFDEDKDLKMMREGITEEFLQAFKNAFLQYVQGKWEEARAGFSQAEQLKGEKDGPCQSLLLFIEEHNGVAPISWMGYRELIEK